MRDEDEESVPADGLPPPSVALLSPGQPAHGGPTTREWKAVGPWRCSPLYLLSGKQLIHITPKVKPRCGLKCDPSKRNTSFNNRSLGSIEARARMMESHTGFSK